MTKLKKIGYIKRIKNLFKPYIYRLMPTLVSLSQKVTSLHHMKTTYTHILKA